MYGCTVRKIAPRSTARSLQVLFPKSVGARIVLAELLYQSDKIVEASRTYEKALRASNNRDIALRAYRIRSQASERGPESLLLGYLDRVPNDYRVRLILAQDYQRRGDVRNQLDGQRSPRDRPILPGPPAEISCPAVQTRDVA